MTIDYRILIGKSLSLTEEKQVERAIQSTFNEVNAIYNKWNPNSELTALNNHSIHTPFPLSPKLEKLLLMTNEMVSLTDGKFDPTVESVQELWKQGHIPSEKDLQSRAVGWHHLHFTAGQVIKTQDVKIDLGGIAKGYAVDLLLEALKIEGFSDIYVEWGGEIAAAGKHPTGRPWTVYISRLEDTSPHHAIDILSLENKAVATSGDYLQQWQIGEETYCHIIDPRTKKALKTTRTSVASASVCAQSCAVADGLATAAMLFSSVDDAKKWLEEIKSKQPDIDFWLMSRG